MFVLNPSTKSWYFPLTIDLFVHATYTGIFSPFTTLLIPFLWRRQGHSAPYFVLATAYVVFLVILSLLSALNKRLAYGAPRKVNLADEVVVITGGAGGLGGLVAQIYAMKGVSVAVLDVRRPEWLAQEKGTENEDREEREEMEMQGVRWYKCDVGDRRQVERVGKEIQKDMGTPTILINNAGIVNGKPLLSLTEEEIDQTFRVNTLSHFHTIQTFLPGMLQLGHGTIVTVSSVLGRLGAANLSAYTSSKAALLAMHASLTGELSSLMRARGSLSPASSTASTPTSLSSAMQSHDSPPNIKTILLTPGQLSTPLFASLKTPNSFFGPVVDAKDIAMELVGMIDRGESGEISMPFYARWVPLLDVFPVGLRSVFRRWSGADDAMEDMLKTRG